MTHYQPLLPLKKIYFYSPSKKVFIFTTDYEQLPEDYVVMNFAQMQGKETELAREAQITDTVK